MYWSSVDDVLCFSGVLVEQGQSKWFCKMNEHSFCLAHLFLLLVSLLLLGCPGREREMCLYSAFDRTWCFIVFDFSTFSFRWLAASLACYARVSELGSELVFFFIFVEKFHSVRNTWIFRCGVLNRATASVYMIMGECILFVVVFHMGNNGKRERANPLWVDGIHRGARAWVRKTIDRVSVVATAAFMWLP